MKELTAKASLDRSVKFWFEHCGYNKDQVKQKICDWFDIAYSPTDERLAKSAKLAELKD